MMLLGRLVHLRRQCRGSERLEHRPRWSGRSELSWSIHEFDEGHGCRIRIPSACMQHANVSALAFSARIPRGQHATSVAHFASALVFFFTCLVPSATRTAFATHLYRSAISPKSFSITCFPRTTRSACLLEWSVPFFPRETILSANRRSSLAFGSVVLILSCSSSCDTIVLHVFVSSVHPPSTNPRGACWRAFRRTAAWTGDGPWSVPASASPNDG